VLHHRRGLADARERAEGRPLEARIDVELLLNLKKLRHIAATASPLVKESLLTEERLVSSLSPSAVRLT